LSTIRIIEDGVWFMPDPERIATMRIVDLPADKRNLRRTHTEYVVIYALVDPRDEQIRYIGKTEKRIAQRLQEHIERPVNGGTRAWIGELAGFGLSPRIEPITCCGERYWEGQECFWVRFARMRGARLLNRDPGGVCRNRDGSLNTTGHVKNFIAKKLGKKDFVNDWKGRAERLSRTKRRAEEKAARRAKRRRQFDPVRGVRLSWRERCMIAAEEVARAAVSIEPVIRKRALPQSGP
jgi:hypothetical protein